MEREVKTIKLINCEVDIVTYLTWGEKEKVQASMMGGVNFDAVGNKKMDGDRYMETKYKLLEICIKEIRIGEKEPVKFSKKWMDNLKIEDGDLLYESIDELSKKK